MGTRFFLVPPIFIIEPINVSGYFANASVDTYLNGGTLSAEGNGYVECKYTADYPNMKGCFEVSLEYYMDAADMLAAAFPGNTLAKVGMNNISIGARFNYGSTEKDFSKVLKYLQTLDLSKLNSDRMTIIWLDTAMTVSKDYVIPYGVALALNAKLTIPSGRTFSVIGEVWKYSAGIFNLYGTLNIFGYIWYEDNSGLIIGNDGCNININTNAAYNMTQLKAMIKAAGGNYRFINAVADGTFNINESITIPSNIEIDFIGPVNLAKGKTLTNNGYLTFEGGNLDVRGVLTNKSNILIKENAGLNICAGGKVANSGYFTVNGTYNNSGTASGDVIECARTVSTSEEFWQGVEDGANLFYISGPVRIDRDITFTSPSFHLSVDILSGGSLTVADGATMTITGKTSVVSQQGSALIVESGGRIVNTSQQGNWFYGTVSVSGTIDNYGTLGMGMSSGYSPEMTINDGGVLNNYKYAEFPVLNGSTLTLNSGATVNNYADCGVWVKYGSIVNIASDAVFSLSSDAYFEKDDSSYINGTISNERFPIVYNVNGGSPIEDGSYTIEDTVNLPVPSKEGYSFAGWYTNARFSGSAVTVIPAGSKGEKVFYAKWTPDPAYGFLNYTISFDGNGATKGTMKPMAMKVGTTKVLTSNAFSRTGYIFDGWSTDINGNTEYANKAKVLDLCISEGRADIVLYAVWKPIEYTVTFSGNGGTLIGNAKVKSYVSAGTYRYDSDTVLDENEFERPGYVFSGWTLKKGVLAAYADEDSVMNLSSKNKGKVTLYATWEYSVAFDGNGGTGAMEDQILVSDVSMKLNNGTFEKEGCYLAGWNVTKAAADKGTVKYKDGASVKNIGLGKTLYAVWKPLTYSIKFDGNGGSGKMSNLSMTYGKAKALTANAFKKAGCTFVEWNTSPDGTGISFDNKEKVTTKILPGYNKAVVPLYAIWRDASKLVGIAMPTKDLSRWKRDASVMKSQLESVGYDVELMYGANDVPTQKSQIEKMIDDGANVLIIAAIDVDALATVLAKAKTKGIPVISYDRLIMDSDAVSYFLTFDFWQVGVLQGEFIEDKLNLKQNDGKTYNIEFVTGDLGDNHINFFYDGAMSILQPYLNSGKLNCRSGQVAKSDVATSAWAPNVAQARFENILATYYSDAQLDAVLCSNDSTALGVENALASSYSNSVYPVITGQDCDLAIMNRMINGKQAMSVFKDTDTLAAQAAVMADAILRGTDVPVNDTETYNNGTGFIPSFLCAPVVVTAENYVELLVNTGYYTKEEIINAG